MRRLVGTWKPFAIGISLLAYSGWAHAQGILLPTDSKLGPLAVVYQRVNVTIQDQAAVTRVEQEFRNPTNQPLEATYLFPVPRDATVQDFAMWIDGKRTKGELVEANQARKIYSDIVRRLKDPGLLERMDDKLFRVRVFPVPAQGTQKIELSFTEVVKQDAGLAEYVYPLYAESTPIKTERDFTVRVELKSTDPLKSIYSPSHEVGITREGDHRAVVGYEANQFVLGKDFRLLWSTEQGPVGLTAIPYKPQAGEDGYLLLLLTPSAETTADQRVPRDVVFILDSSGSMAGEKLKQAKGAIVQCLARLQPTDRFNIIRFSTTVDLFEKSFVSADDDHKKKGTDWIEKIEATGGTAIADAIDAALKARADDARNFTVIFLTDGQPTIGVTDPKAIIQQTESKNTAGTRIFSFGVGDDVNTTLLDQISDKTRGTSSYVRPNENIEVKVSSFFDKINHPVLSNLELAVEGSGVKLSDMYPPKLPDLFHGSQLVVAARYSGSGTPKFKFTGKLGTEEKTFEFTPSLPGEKTDNDFVGLLWAQRKIGYLLDQIRNSGENKELVDEVTSIAKKFGIVTPYTSYLLVPDEKPVVNVAPAMPRERYWYGGSPRSVGGMGGAVPGGTGGDMAPEALRKVERQQNVLAGRDGRPAALQLNLQSGGVAVENAQVFSDLKNSDQLQRAIVQSQNVAGRRFDNRGGAWIEDKFDDKGKVVRVKYLSDAYFQLVTQNEENRRILSQGERVAWRTPKGLMIVIDGEGKETLTPMELSELFGS
ncbi:VWA domain-containing protein [bacterium]|nr:VWA domain-containing protein [bacterium]